MYCDYKTIKIEVFTVNLVFHLINQPCLLLFFIFVKCKARNIKYEIRNIKYMRCDVKRAMIIQEYIGRDIRMS